MGIFLGRFIREQASQDLSVTSLSKAVTVPKGVLRKLTEVYVKGTTSLNTETFSIYKDPGGDTTYRSTLVTNTFGAGEDRYVFRPTGECMLFADDVITAVTGGIINAGTAKVTLEFLEG